MPKIEDYIIPLFLDCDESTFIGSAFFIDNYLVTAGHIARYHRIYYVKIGDEFLTLMPNNRLVSLFPDEKFPENDIAIYYIGELESPLVLSNESPQISDLLAKNRRFYNSEISRWCNRRIGHQSLSL